MNEGSGGRRHAQRWAGCGAGPRGRQPELQRSVPRSTPGRIPGAHRSALLAAALAGTALLAVACGGSAKPVSAALTNYQKALAFSQCMRAHGEPGFPDPQPNGNLLINGPKDHLNGALMNSASKACQHLMPLGPPMTAAQRQKLTAQALKFVACMRAHGLPTFADPGRELARHRDCSCRVALRPTQPVLKNAQQACRHLIPFGPP